MLIPVYWHNPLIILNHAYIFVFFTGMTEQIVADPDGAALAVEIEGDAAAGALLAHPADDAGERDIL